MLQIFVDDSGNRPEHGLFVLGGLISDVGRWESFCHEWRASLDRDGLRYFKASEANALEGCFERGWNRSLADQKADELAEIAAKHARYRIHAIIRWADFLSYISPVQDDAPHIGEVWGHPYFLCYFALAARFARFCRENSITEKHEFIFDEQGSTGSAAAKVISTLQEQAMIREGFGGIPSFSDDKTSLPLQAADLYAWNVRDYYAKGSVVPKNHISVKRTLFELPGVEFFMNSELLSEARTNMYALAILKEAIQKSAGLALEFHDGASPTSQRRTRK